VLFNGFVDSVAAKLRSRIYVCINDNCSMQFTNCLIQSLKPVSKLSHQTKSADDPMNFTQFVDKYAASKVRSTHLAVTGLAAGLLTTALTITDNAAWAQDVSNLETPPPLSSEELGRSINTPSGSGLINGDSADNADGSTQGTADVVTEFRIQQKLYLIEVKPKLGGNYYMQDNDGDGSLDEYRQNAERDANIGKWRLGSW